MLSKVSFILSAVVILVVSFLFYPRWNKPGSEATLSWDVAGYYWYLPATIIYGDLKKQEFADSIVQQYHPLGGDKPTFKHEGTGNCVNKYSSGLAVLYSPFFLVAHIVAKPLGYPADGFSIPYQLAIQLASVLVSLLGLWYYRKFLKIYFADRVVAVMLLLLVAGTNYLNYTAIDGGLTHNWLFTIYALLLLNTYYFYDKPRLKYSLGLGALIGIAILIRPTEIIAVSIPVLWGLEKISIQSIRGRFSFLWLNRKWVLLTSVVVLCIGSIQLFYWLYVTGEPLVYSYEHQGFSWKHPHFFDYMLSYRSGWLVYTPLLFFAFIGIVPFLFNGKNKVLILSFFFISLYITSAWDIWWYSGMGGRAMIQYYPFVFILFAYLIEYLFTTKVVKWVALPVILVFTYVNIWFTYHAHGGGLYDANAMNKNYYWKVIGRLSAPKEVEKLKDTDEYFEGRPKNIQVIYKTGFEEDTTESKEHIINGNRSVYFDGEREYGPEIVIPFNNKEADWVRAGLTAKPLSKEWYGWKMIQFILTFKSSTNDNVKTRMIRVNRIAEEQKVSNIYFDMKIPEGKVDSLKIWFWNPGSDIPVILDDLTIQTFEE